MNRSSRLKGPVPVPPSNPAPRSDRGAHTAGDRQGGRAEQRVGSDTRRGRHRRHRPCRYRQAADNHRRGHSPSNKTNHHVQPPPCPRRPEMRPPCPNTTSLTPALFALPLRHDDAGASTHQRRCQGPRRERSWRGTAGTTDSPPRPPAGCDCCAGWSRPSSSSSTTTTPLGIGTGPCCWSGSPGRCGVALDVADVEERTEGVVVGWGSAGQRPTRRALADRPASPI